MSRTGQKRLVSNSYDHIAADMLRLATSEPPGRKAGYLERVTSGLPPDARVLDLGCGPGLQSAWLSERFRTTGVDISRGQLALARERAPGASLLLADMSSLAFAPQSFDAIVAFYSIIHLPREEHASLFASMHGWLKPHGRAVVVLGSEDSEGSETNWLDFGADMWWSHFDAQTGLEMLRAAGFTIIESAIEPDSLVGEGGHLFAICEKP
jgi:cyclopropane fatty-acyl-phospholipid synthase-like methyltransferase